MTEKTELERLREHNAELLGEAKAAKAKIKQYETEAATLKAERDAAVKRLYDATTGRRVNALVESLMPGKLSRFLLAELQEQGRLKIEGEEITLHNADGTPAKISPDDHEAVYTWLRDEGTFNHVLRGSGASGGGASGSSIAPSSSTPEPKPEEKPFPSFGLK